ncbi:MAG TPA: QueG-associated DUF1730 domain-containing protein, partial [Chthoniobacterales bacterium]|nr:QueG-associated DUF1730 domain-containing protein [Chthoniobacterales bacterium]
MNAAAMTALELKTRVVDLARALGFDSCRIANCSPPAHADEFGDWLNEGSHGEMHYMARAEEKRRDPGKILPGAKSIIVLALNYFHSEPEWRLSEAEKGAHGRIARYAWGDDYHELIEAKLHKIDNFLREFGGEQKCYVD